MRIWKNRLLAALAVVAFIGGAAGQYLYPGNPAPPSDMVSMITGVVLSLAWYHLDSEQIGYRRGRWLSVAIVAIGLFAFPYYFLQSRGLKRGLVYSAVFLALVLAWSALQFAGANAVHLWLQS